MILVGSAIAGVVVGPAFHSDRPSAVVAAGLDIAVVAEHTKGFRPVGRAFGGAEPFERGRGSLTYEIGGMVVVPSEDTAVIRVGLVARGTRLQRTVPLPLQTERRTDNDQRFGVVPAGLFRAELAWTPEAPVVIGMEAGMSAWLPVLSSCEDLAVSSDRLFVCSTWPAGVTASLRARKTFRSGLTLQASAGTHIMASVGGVFRHQALKARDGRSSTPRR